MSNPSQNLAKSGYRLTDVLDLLKKEVMVSLNCHAIGTIQDVNFTKQTAQVTINYLRTFMQPAQGAGTDVANTYSPVTVPYPVLIDCPFISIQGGGFALTTPIKKGDTCLLLFNDRDMDDWFKSNQVGPVPTQRFHSMTDAIALVGLRAGSNPIQNYDNSHMQMVSEGGAKLGISNTKIRATNAAGKSLKDLFSDLITALNTAPLILVTGAPGGPSPINPAITALLTTLQTEVNALLE